MWPQLCIEWVVAVLKQAFGVIERQRLRNGFLRVNNQGRWCTLNGGSDEHSMDVGIEQGVAVRRCLDGMM
jgi:hypothetical protein